MLRPEKLFSLALFYSTVSLVPIIFTMDVWCGDNLTDQLKREIQSTVTAADSCDGGINVWWSKFVNTHLSHSRQWFNIHLKLSDIK